MSASELLAIDHFELWGTVGAVCVTDARRLGDARAILDEAIDIVERACSRFRPDAELAALNSAAGQGPFRVSETLFDLIAAATDAARLTGGACDPTVLPALLALGYDTDIEAIRGRDLDGGLAAHRAPGVTAISTDRPSMTVSLAPGCAIDLGAVGKAWCADLAAERIEHRLSVGCVVDLGGDLRVAGPAPSGGWHVAVARDARQDAAAADETVAVSTGGVATSSTRLRRWRRGGVEVHHIVDPSTGLPADSPWSEVTVAAATCTRANALSTAAVVWGEDAVFEIPQRGAAARLVRHDGGIERVGGWPEPEDPR